MKRTRVRTLLLLGVLAASLGIGVSVVSAAPSESVDEAGCTSGNARSMFESFFSFLEDAVPPCQFRLFWDGQTVTFCEDDVILGGVNYRWGYDELGELGMSREDAVADLELFEDRVWLDGVEQLIEETAIKDADTERFGRIVWLQHAFFAQLEPGDHTSLWVGSYDGVPDASATVTLHIVPRAGCG